MKTSLQLLRIYAFFTGCLYLAFSGGFITADGVLFGLCENFFASYPMLFMMISGSLLLGKKPYGAGKFYLNRIIKIGIPFAVSSFVCLAVKIGFSVSFGFLRDFTMTFLTGMIDERYSFLYKIFIFYLMAPFLSGMLEALNDKSKKALLILIVCYFAFFDICVLTDMRLAIRGYPFLNLYAYAIAGYLVSHIGFGAKHQKGLLLAGAVGLAVSSLEFLFLDGRNWALDTYCPTRFFICIGIYLLFTRMHIPDGKLKKGIDTAGRMTYYASLLVPPLLCFFT